jgi:ABC-2 type transport system permease protein
MRWRNVYEVTRREFLERVHKKSFLIMTLLTPVFIIGVSVLPGYLATRHSGGAVKVALVDHAGWAAPILQKETASKAPLQNDNAMDMDADLPGGTNVRKAAVTFVTPAKGTTLETLKKDVEAKKLDGILLLSTDPKHELAATYYGKNLANPQLMGLLSDRLNRALMLHKLNTLGIDPALASQLQAKASLKLEKIERGGKTQKVSFMGEFFKGIIYAMVLYMMILLYGVAVMRGVMEEKNGKIAEVLLSSFRPFELMMGKIIGLASVGLLQYAIWLLLGVAGVLALMSQGVVGPKLLHALPGPYELTIVGAFFILGFFFYSSLYAAVGALSSTDQEAQQLQMPVTVMIIVPLIILMPIMATPNAGWVAGISLVPFFAPVLMPLRVGISQVPGWQVLAAIGIMIAGTVVVGWISAKIYRVGILMTGKRPSVPEIMRWIREA